MKKHLVGILLTIPATLSIATAAHADVVSTKAADLVGTQANNQQTLAQKNFSVAQNENAEADDSNLPAANYWYVGGRAGVGFPSNVKGNYVEPSASPFAELSESNSLELNNAFQGSIAAGYQWEQVRAELELTFGSYGVDRYAYNGIYGGIPDSGSNKASGSVSATTLMVNGYWDIPTGSKWRPYLGAGVGVGFPSASEVKVDEDGVKYQIPSASGTSFAIQGKAGIQYEVTKKGNVFLELGYKNIGGFSGSDPNISGSKVNYDAVNSFAIGIGYRQGF
ncbi:MAG: outer membrane beta-barrel protein [Scytonematopsis contorta HA4267-MV1]|jgi:opacity protein-like surface antigen|nr:outer membrane beta-barrel protein [Scytonematopsis contorta HA4267-MV1]